MAKSIAIYTSLPAYLGGKRQLSNLILAEIGRILPRERWRSSTLLDPFCGGGSLALLAKYAGFRVVASDISTRAVVVARALIANSRVRLTHEDVLGLFVQPRGEYAEVATKNSPKVFDSMQAAWLDRALAQASQRAEPKRSLLLLLIVKLVLKAKPMSLLSATDAAAANRGDFDKVSSRRLGHYLRARGMFAPGHVWAVAQSVNAGVFGGTGVALQGDACEVIRATTADVVYLDPPYGGTTAYQREYAVLDELLGDENTTSTVPELEELLAAAALIPLLVLSYGGPSMTLAQLKDLVSRHRKVEGALAIPYAHLRSIATKEKNEVNKELLIIARQ